MEKITLRQDYNEKYQIFHVMGHFPYRLNVTYGILSVFNSTLIHDGRHFQTLWASGGKTAN